MPLIHYFHLGLYAAPAAVSDHPYTSTPASSAISRYGDYLEGVYSRSPVSSDGKFPPTPSKTYVNLALVKRTSEIRDLEDVRKNMLHGRVSEMLRGKKKIKTNDIVKPQDNGSPVSLVFVEGPPGVGKSTLAWELCRRWDRKQYDLAVLLRLREREMQQMKGVEDLFPHEDKNLQKSVAIKVLEKEGKGVLFIFDGFDELPVDLRSKGFLSRMMQGKVLPKCSLLVTSRPSATKDLIMACTPIQRHVEILGFTQECIKGYASSIFSDEPELLKDFLQYISPSINPVINSLMYIPLNAAIIVHMYKNSRNKLGSPIPRTLTQVYTQLCLILLQRYTDSVDQKNKIVITKFSDLPGTYYNSFLKLAQLAFEQYQRHSIVFYSPNVHKELVHFGFLDSVSSLHDRDGVSYNFLHLTLQEFLAAYHITQLSNGIDVFKHHSKDRRWELVWRFVSGLTGFRYFVDSVKCDAFVFASENDVYLEVRNLLLHCLFESQLMFDCIKVLGRNKIYSNQGAIFSFALDSIQTSPLDRYVLGYCIAHCSTATSWKVCMRSGSDESFMWGLHSNHRGRGYGLISELEIVDVDLASLDSCPSTILSHIYHLPLTLIDDINKCVQILLLGNNLTPLILGVRRSPLLLDAIFKNNVKALKWHCSESDPSLLSDFLFCIHGLINPPSNKLKCLNIQCASPVDITFLCNVLFGPSSLNQLTLSLPRFAEDSFKLLENNTCLTTVSISGEDSLPLKPLVKILHNNKTIEKLQWGPVKFQHSDSLSEQVITLNKALSSNTTLKELTLTSCQSRGASLINDTRVKISRPSRRLSSESHKIKYVQVALQSLAGITVGLNLFCTLNDYTSNIYMFKLLLFILISCICPASGSYYSALCLCRRLIKVMHVCVTVISVIQLLVSLAGVHVLSLSHYLPSLIIIQFYTVSCYFFLYPELL